MPAPMKNRMNPHRAFLIRPKPTTATNDAAAIPKMSPFPASSKIPAIPRNPPCVQSPNRFFEQQFSLGPHGSRRRLRGCFHATLSNQHLAVIRTVAPS
jgi:hypothetical protein